MQTTLTVTATDLEVWSKRLDARSQLPRLIRRLIRASTKDISAFRFPSDEGTQLSGWDGRLTAKGQPPFVPAGSSVWEMGVDTNIKSKADSDYDKRTATPGDVTPSETTYVFVTPRRWSTKDKWVTEKNAEGKWQNVIAYDAEDLEIWLEDTPSVRAWISELIGKHLPSVQTLDNFWDTWSSATKPNLNPRFVIGGREAMRAELLQWLSGSPEAFQLRADSPKEAVAFFASVVMSEDEQARELLLSRILIVEDAASWRALIQRETKPIILIPLFDYTDTIGFAVSHGHHVFVPLYRNASDGIPVLKRPNRDELEKALNEMGVTGDRGRDLATLARRSLQAFRSKIAFSLPVPAWATAEEAKHLLPMLFVQKWSNKEENKDGISDWSIIAAIASTSVPEVRQSATRLLNVPDPPIRKSGEGWIISAPENTWRLVARYVDKELLQRFIENALIVIGLRNPALDLPKEKQFMASVYGKQMPYSGLLREGMAGTLALMASLSEEVAIGSGEKGDTVAIATVRQLLENIHEDIDGWTSISYLLPLLSEAAPGAFLDAVDKGLTGNEPLLQSIFQDQGDPLTTSSPHTGLLWALETVAWEQNYLGRAALCLSRLAEIDPGGKLGNRPIGSLRDIFLCWKPHTNAPLVRRLKVLDALRKRTPRAAWQLLLMLLPTGHSSVSPTHKPDWRDWAPEDQKSIYVSEYVEATTGILQRAFSDAQGDANRIATLISKSGSLTPDQRTYLLDAVGNIDLSFFSIEEKENIRQSIRSIVAHHREFPDADWSMQSDQVDRLETIHDLLDTGDPIIGSLWLFGEHTPLMHARRHDDWEAYEAEVRELRTNTLRRISEDLGWEGIQNLASRVKQPHLVGEILAADVALLPIKEDEMLRDGFSSTEDWYRLLAHTYSLVSSWHRPDIWLAEKMKVVAGRFWSPEAVARLLLSVPYSRAVNDALDHTQEETQTFYWQSLSNVRLPESAEDADRLVSQLINRGRAHLAVEVSGRSSRSGKALLSPERIAEMLDAAATTLPPSGTLSSSFSYYVADHLDALEKSEYPRDSLARLEIQYIPLCDHYRQPKVIHEQLCESPELLVQIISILFLPRNRDRSQPSPKSEYSDEVVHALWKVLHSWRNMPGIQEDNIVNPDTLQVWVRRTRELGQECDRAEITDQHIGKALAHSPSDPDDGAWPHQVVRNIMENEASPHIEKGFEIEIFNTRGVTSRMPTDGGEQERILAAKYKAWADESADIYPRTAATLLSIANSYKSEADREDGSAELTQDLWR